MAIKTYRAKSVAEALSLVKRDLGPDAVILHTKSHRTGGILGVGGHTITEITATADRSVARAVAAKRNGGAAGQGPSEGQSEPRRGQARRTAMPSLVAKSAGEGGNANLTDPLAARLDAASRAERRGAMGLGGGRPAEHQPEARVERSGMPSAPPMPPRPSVTVTAPGAAREVAIEALRSVGLDAAPQEREHRGVAGGSRGVGSRDPRAVERLTPEMLNLGGSGVERRPGAPALVGKPRIVAPPGIQEAERSSAETIEGGTPPTVAPKAKPQVSAPVVASQVEPKVEAGSTPDLATELAALKRMVGRVLQAQPGLAGVGIPEALEECYLSLLEGEVASEIADQVVGRVRDELQPGELMDRQAVRQCVLRHLAGFIPTTEGLPQAVSTDGRPLTIALVGPTGVGKTTTLAKLAATYKLRKGKRVGLITSDTYRIAAVDQLRTYANIIGLALKVVQTPGEMRAACEELADCDVILVDTAGRSQRDSGRLDELQGLLAAAEPHQTHLVLSSTSSERVLAQAAERFAVIEPDHVVFTKLDEAVSLGVLINTVRRVGATLSFVTTGQEVPDQIEVGNADRLARLVLDGRAVR